MSNKFLCKRREKTKPSFQRRINFISTLFHSNFLTRKEWKKSCNEIFILPSLCLWEREFLFQIYLCIMWFERNIRNKKKLFLFSVYCKYHKSKKSFAFKRENEEIFVSTFCRISYCLHFCILLPICAWLFVVGTQSNFTIFFHSSLFQSNEKKQKNYL